MFNMCCILFINAAVFVSRNEPNYCAHIFHISKFDKPKFDNLNDMLCNEIKQNTGTKHVCLFETRKRRKRKMYTNKCSDCHSHSLPLNGLDGLLLWVCVGVWMHVCGVLAYFAKYKCLHQSGKSVC